ncbi:MAG: FixH family protein [candidate division Zixibacteria bacterium]|nr:FixH family protein [candidate division Zixibacteria bacterium]
MTKEAGKSQWGLAVYALYGGFVVFVLAMVVFASFNDIQLVTPDYYQQELAYQERIDRSRLTIERQAIPGVVYESENNRITVSFADTWPPDQYEGTLALFRPSDAALDITLPVRPDSVLHQSVGAAGLARGLWRVQITWNVGELAFYSEQTVYLP